MVLGLSVLEVWVCDVFKCIGCLCLTLGVLLVRILFDVYV